MKYYIGLDIGGTKCAVTVGHSSNGEITVDEKTRFMTAECADKKAFFEKVFKACDKYNEKYAVEAVGISCGGPLNEKSGTIISPPSLPLLHNTEIVKIISDRYKKPAYLRNDANACALAEWLYGAGKGTVNMVFLTFGTGLGAGLILDGRLYSGTNGNAGEIGHVRLSEFGPSGYGKAGSVEGFCSGRGISQLGYTLGSEAVQSGKTPLYFENGIPTSSISAKDIAVAADKGDETALKVYSTSGKYLGKALSVIIDILNPERIVIGSVFQRSGHLLAAAANEVIKQEALSASRECCEIVPALLGDDVGDIAALSAAAYEDGI